MALPSKVKKNASFSFKQWLQTNQFNLFFLGFLVFLAYVNSFNNSFVSDDVWGILKNEKIGSLEYFRQKAPLFLQPAIFSAVNAIFGKVPVAFRIVNIFFHLGSVWVFFFVSGRIISKKAALLASTLLAVHPLQSEAVVWISAGAYIWYSFFLLLSFAFYIFYERGRVWLLLSYLSYLGALLASPVAAVWPTILFLYQLVFGHLKKDWRKLIIPTLMSIAWLAFFAMEIKAKEGLMSVMLGTGQEITNTQKIIRIPVAITSYWELLIWPKALTFYHSEFIVTKLELGVRISAVVFSLSLLGFALANLLRLVKIKVLEPISKPALIFWAGFFFLGIAPMLAPFTVASLVAERYAYFAAIGAYALFGMFVAAIIKKHKNSELWVTVASCIIVLLFLGRTAVRTEDWKTADHLWVAAAKTSPHSHQNHNNLGDLWARRGEYGKAVKEFETAISLAPQFAPAYYNLANVYVLMGEFDQAEVNFLKSIRYNPTQRDAYLNLAALYQRQGRENEARNLLKKLR